MVKEKIIERMKILRLSYPNILTLNGANKNKTQAM
jgi:hypothetical protein